MLTARISSSDSNAPGDAKRELFVAGLQDAGGADGVLRLQRGDQGGAIDAQSRELLGGELDDDLFVLRAEDLDLGHVRHAQQPCADLLDVVAKLAVGETVRGEAVDDPEGIAELVVEAGPDDARPAGYGGCRRRSCERDTRCREPRLAGVLPFRLTKMVVTPALVKLRRKSRFGVSLSLRSIRSVTWSSVSFRVAPGHAACTTIVLKVNAGSSLRPRR